MSIKHFEDLHYSEIQKFLLNYPSYDATEKVDGSQLYFGIHDGRFYTSYIDTRYFNESEYPLIFSSNYRRFAHLALEQCYDMFLQCGMTEGDCVKVEVLYGSLPNVVEYNSNNYIVFLECVRGSIDLETIEQKFSNHTVSVTMNTLVTETGLEVNLSELSRDVTFIRVPKWNLASDINLNQEYSYLEEFLNIEDEQSGLNYSSILDVNLSHTSKYSTDKQNMSRIKKQVKELYSERVLSIKEQLLNKILRNRSGALGSNWVEGVVFSSNGSKFKLVDKDIFRKLQMFYWQERVKIQQADADKVKQFYQDYIESWKSKQIFIEGLGRHFTYTLPVHKRTLESYASKLAYENTQISEITA